MNDYMLSIYRALNTKDFKDFIPINTWWLAVRTNNNAIHVLPQIIIANGDAVYVFSHRFPL